MDDEEFERMNRRNKRLNWDDYEWVRDHCPSCSEIGAGTGSGTDLRQDGIEFIGAQVFGHTANMVDIEEKTIESGRYITDEEVQRSALVVVLGSDIKEKFFPNQDAIGKTLKVRGLPMRVIGVEEKRGSFFGDSFDRHIYIPVTTHMQIFGRNGLQIHGSSRTRENFQGAIEDARITGSEAVVRGELGLESLELRVIHDLHQAPDMRVETLDDGAHVAELEVLIGGALGRRAEELDVPVAHLEGRSGVREGARVGSRSMPPIRAPSVRPRAAVHLGATVAWSDRGWIPAPVHGG
jgi:hypothetical protein